MKWSNNVCIIICILVNVCKKVSGYIVNFVFRYSYSTCVSVFTIKGHKGVYAARAHGVLIVKILNECFLRILVYKYVLENILCMLWSSLFPFTGILAVFMEKKFEFSNYTPIWLGETIGKTIFSNTFAWRFVVFAYTESSITRAVISVKCARAVMFTPSVAMGTTSAFVGFICEKWYIVIAAGYRQYIKIKYKCSLDVLHNVQDRQSYIT